MEQLRLYAPPVKDTGNEAVSSAVSEETVGDDELERRLRAAGAILATGAIRAVLRERSSQSAETDTARQDDSEGKEAVETSAAVPV